MLEGVALRLLANRVASNSIELLDLEEHHNNRVAARRRAHNRSWRWRALR